MTGGQSGNRSSDASPSMLSTDGIDSAHLGEILEATRESKACARPLENILERLSRLHAKVESLEGLMEDCKDTITMLASNGPLERQLSGGTMASASASWPLSDVGGMRHGERTTGGQLNGEFRGIPEFDAHTDSGVETKSCGLISPRTGTSDEVKYQKSLCSMASLGSGEDADGVDDKLSDGRSPDQPTLLERAAEFLEDPDSGRWAAFWSRGSSCFVLASVLVPLSQLQTPALITGVEAAALETAIEVAFTLETFARFLTYGLGRLAFFKNKFNLLDIASCIPLVVRIAVGFTLPERLPSEWEAENLSQWALLCFVPLLRMLKIVRRNRVQLHLFDTMLGSVAETLQFLAFVAVLFILFFSGVLYLVEPRESIESYWMASWVTIVTMTTVGYGDVTATTPLGKVVTSFLIVCSVLFMAIPIGVLGNAFSAVWKDRDLILLINQTQRWMTQWGHNPEDLTDVFMKYSSAGSRELNIEDFQDMMRDFRVKLSEQRIIELFQVFDDDHGGTVDDREFMRVVFPRAWHAMVQAEKEEEEREKKRKEEEERLKKARKKMKRRRNTSGSGSSSTNTVRDGVDIFAFADKDADGTGSAELQLRQTAAALGQRSQDLGKEPDIAEAEIVIPGRLTSEPMSPTIDTVRPPFSRVPERLSIQDF